ncbi:MAG: hypothetical protein AW09_002150 [Candidatus Accumulibacter phosphatis]|uniref:Uncharacterized protein n=1 Tax=Candidatus Accumulibacter phosphatis TaxID=327160 RepID=A0A080LVL7_9PROT|nr:MAG: hypothetical protein AW09_002150 [Candidatus Accumulibacter phosphatis]
MLAKPQAMQDGAHAVLVQAGGRGRAARKIIVGIILRVDRATFQEMHWLVEHTGIAAGTDVAADRQRQPEIVVRTVRTHPPARRWMPPVLDVAFQELPTGAQQQMLPQQPGLGVDQRHHVLQLVAEPEGAARLVVAATRPESAGQCLVDQPAIGQHIDRRVGGAHLHGTKRVLPVLPDGCERAVCRQAAAKAPHQLVGFVSVAADTEPKDNLPLLPVGQVETDLDCAAGIQASPHLAGKAPAMQCGRIAQRAVAPQEFRAVAAELAQRVIDVEEGDAIGELGTVGVARVERAASGVDFGTDMHRRFGAQIAQHPLDIGCRREAARPARFIAHFQHRELDRRVDGHVHPQFRADAFRSGREHAVAKSVSDHIGRRRAHGQRCRRPELAGLFIAQVEGFATRIGHRVVVPRGQTEFVRVLAPGVGNAAFRNDAAKMRIRQDVDPRCRRHLLRREKDDVLAAVWRESSQAIEQDQFRTRRRGGGKL